MHSPWKSIYISVIVNGLRVKINIISYHLMNKRLFSLYDPALPGRDVWRDDFDVLKY